MVEYLPLVCGAGLVKVHVTFVHHNQVNNVVHGSLQVNEDTMYLGLHTQTQVTAFVDIRIEGCIDEVSLQIHGLERSDMNVSGSVANHVLEVESGPLLERLRFNGEVRVAVDLQLVETKIKPEIEFTYH